MAISETTLKDVMLLPSFDAGGDWPLFYIPGEIGCHPAATGSKAKSPSLELSFTCDNLEKSVTDLKSRDVEFLQDVQDMGWGLLTSFKMPGGITGVLFEPQYRRPRK